MKTSPCRPFAISEASLAFSRGAPPPLADAPRTARRRASAPAWPQALQLLTLALTLARPAAAQTWSNRGFVDGAVLAFPQEAANDTTRLVGNLLVRDEVFVKPAPWVQFTGGLDLRADSHDQMENRWRVDWSDRGVRRPRLSVRRLSATFTRRALTFDVGKQFIRWGKTDIVTPTDRFAPRDFLNVVDTEFLAVAGVRASVSVGGGSLEAVWVPRFTPSRIPVPNQRWAAVPGGVSIASIADDGSALPEGSEAGARWAQTGSGFEYSLSFFDGFNHLPNLEAGFRPLPSFAAPGPLSVELTRAYPAIRSYGADAAVSTPLFTVKGEAAYFTSESAATDEYVLYAVQLERQTGEWMLVAGYAGEAVTARRAAGTFAPDRGMTRSIVARAAYTIDSNRSLVIEGVARQDGHGFYAKAEYSHARGRHWRATLTTVGLAGRRDDFLGQYRRNSHVAAALRYSF